MIIFDANMILRYLLNDNPAMQKKAKEYLRNGDVMATIEVIAEAVYVLKGIYGMERMRIAETMTAFLDLVECEERTVLRLALRAYAVKSLDFVDCVLYAYNRAKGIEIATFDKKLLRLLADNEQIS